MTLPDLTHLQFLVLGIIMGREISGRELREELAKEGVKKSGPAFYQLMSRLEEAKFIEGWYEQKEVHGQTIRERNYKLTTDGILAFQNTHSFYAKHITLEPLLEG